MYINWIEKLCLKLPGATEPVVFANEVVQERLVEALEAVDPVKCESQPQESGGSDQSEFYGFFVEK